MNKYTKFKSQFKPIIPGFKTKFIYCSDSSDEVILCVFWSILSFFKDCFHSKKKKIDTQVTHRRLKQKPQEVIQSSVIL